ncbi:MAG TPA: helix-turn-helix transcriptional regulator, partial [Tepidisphaeraceae bacterium]|nr:helix-turn-helix transcriptional regulator [Tepidisphaeraceae bacterium]
MNTRQRPKQTKPPTQVTRGSDNIFLDLGFSVKEAAELKVKADLTMKLLRELRSLNLTQVRAAERLGISQPDVSKLMSGRHAGFSIDRLLSLLNALDVDIDIVVRPKRHAPKP